MYISSSQGDRGPIGPKGNVGIPGPRVSDFTDGRSFSVRCYCIYLFITGVCRSFLAGFFIFERQK